jgi:hypothetical protein
MTGVALSTYGSSDGRDLALRPAGGLVVVGGAFGERDPACGGSPSCPYYNGVVLAALNADATLDRSFGDNGATVAPGRSGTIGEFGPSSPATGADALIRGQDFETSDDGRGEHCTRITLPKGYGWRHEPAMANTRYRSKTAPRRSSNSAP